MKPTFLIAAALLTGYAGLCISQSDFEPSITVEPVPSIEPSLWIPELSEEEKAEYKAYVESGEAYADCIQRAHDDAKRITGEDEDHKHHQIVFNGKSRRCNNYKK